MTPTEQLLKLAESLSWQDIKTVDGSWQAVDAGEVIRILVEGFLELRYKNESKQQRDLINETLQRAAEAGK